MRFVLDRKTYPFFRSRQFINLIILTIVLVVIIYAFLDIEPGTKSHAFTFAFIFFIFLASYGIAVVIYLSKQRRASDFSVEDHGIIYKGKTYLWHTIASYHIYGEKQSERSGIVGLGRFINYDPINPYGFARTQIVRVRLRGLLPHYLGLEIDAEKTKELEMLLQHHGIFHLPPWRRFLGI